MGLCCDPQPPGPIDSFDWMRFGSGAFSVERFVSKNSNFDASLLGLEWIIFQVNNVMALSVKCASVFAPFACTVKAHKQNKLQTTNKSINSYF